MAAPARQLEDRLARIERMLAELLARESRRAPSKPVGKREAARLLGIDRSTTLESLIRSGTIRATTIAGRVRITVDEIERLLAVGIPTPEAPRRAKRSRVTSGEVAQIASLRVRDL